MAKESRDKMIMRKKKLKTSLTRIEDANRVVTSTRKSTTTRTKRKRRKQHPLSTCLLSHEKSGEANMTSTKPQSGDTHADLLLLWKPLCHLDQRLSWKPQTMSLTTSNRLSTTNRSKH